MFENTAQCISNCLITSKDSHVFYRSFGLEPVDSANAPMRKDILIQLATYYPEVDLDNVTIEIVNIEGVYSYRVEVKGY